MPVPDIGPWVVPTTVELASTDRRLLDIDFTAQLATGQAVTAPVATLTDETTGQGAATSLFGAPIVAGNVVYQGVGGLTAGHRYRLRITYSPSPPALTGEEGTGDLIVYCPS